MKKFWQFALMLLTHRRLLIGGLIGALFDALCKLGGFGTLTWVIKQFLDKTVTLRMIADEKFTALKADGGPDLTGIVEHLPVSAMGGLALTLGVVFALAILGSLGRFLHVYCSRTASLKTVAKIREMVFARLVYMPMAYSMEHRASEQMSRVVRDSRQVASGFSLLSGKVVRGLFSGAALLIGALILDWQLALLFLAVVPPIFILNRKFGKKVNRATKQALARYGILLGMINEALQAMRVIKIHHAESHTRRRFRSMNETMLNKEMKARVIKAVAAPVTELITMAGVIVAVLAAAWGMYHSDADSSEVVGVLAMLIGSAGSFRTMAGLNIQLELAYAGAENLDEVLSAKSEVNPIGKGERERARLPRHSESIAFENVVFTYPRSESPVLRGVNLTVNHGEVCAIVGPNGSGKTTLLGLVPRLYEPDGGRILLDGLDIAAHSHRSLRRQIAAVTQETVLFEGTIAENIAFNTHGVTDTAVHEAALIAHADEFIRELPEGYDTEVGERGLRLSGGQRQRIAIARAVLRDPSILILDEATSQIDAHSEALIADALGEFSKGRTTFVIAHRLSTVVDADKIVVMHEGQIDAVGSHAQLLANNALYQQLCRTQLQTVDDVE